MPAQVHVDLSEVRVRLSVLRSFLQSPLERLDSLFVPLEVAKAASDMCQGNHAQRIE